MNKSEHNIVHSVHLLLSVKNGTIAITIELRFLAWEFFDLL